MLINHIISFIGDISAVLFLVLIVVYFMPTFVATIRGSRYSSPVIIINVFGGWTVIGWVAAFALAVWPEPEAWELPVRKEPSQ